MSLGCFHSPSREIWMKFDGFTLVHAFHELEHSKINIENWELEDVFAILAARAYIPVPKGRLNTRLSLTGSKAGNLKMIGQIAIKTLKLRGGPLGADTPVIKNIEINLKK